MANIKKIEQIQGEMVEWRHDLHAHPEIAFEETRTADFVARKLAEFGLEVHRGLAKTGVVGTLKNGDGPAIGLRADLDALPINEQTGVAHCSTNSGKMHACGHDGHTTMLLGAAKYLAATKDFKGTVRFIFQPAEELEGGGRVMVEEGLFDKFPVDSVYGMHNMPDMPLGTMSVRGGPGMASAASFEIKVIGKGGHAAAPHEGVDPIVAGAAIVSALQTIASRTVNPTQGIVVSVTQFHAGESAINAIPGTALLRGTARSFDVNAETSVPAMIRRVAEGVAAAHGVKIEFGYQHRYPVLVNSDAESQIAFKVGEEVVGKGKMDAVYPRIMASEDFAFMLNARPGAFVRLGSAYEGRESAMLHSPHFDFNDAALPIGASFWGRLVETVLAK